MKERERERERERELLLESFRKLFWRDLSFKMASEGNNNKKKNGGGGKYSHRLSGMKFMKVRGVEVEKRPALPAV